MPRSLGAMHCQMGQTQIEEVFDQMEQRHLIDCMPCGLSSSRAELPMAAEYACLQSRWLVHRTLYRGLGVQQTLCSADPVRRGMCTPRTVDAADAGLMSDSARIQKIWRFRDIFDGIKGPFDGIKGSCFECMASLFVHVIEIA
jgi:hypothetical protein